MEKPFNTYLLQHEQQPLNSLPTSEVLHCSSAHPLSSNIKFKQSQSSAFQPYVKASNYSASLSIPQFQRRKLNFSSPDDELNSAAASSVCNSNALKENEVAKKDSQINETPFSQQLQSFVSPRQNLGVFSANTAETSVYSDRFLRRLRSLYKIPGQPYIKKKA